MNERTKEIIAKLSRDSLNDGKIEFSYNNGKGHFCINSTVEFIRYTTIGWFKDFMKVVSLSDNAPTIAGYINSMVKTMHPLIQNEIKEYERRKDESIVKGLKQYEKMLISMNEYLVKHFNVSPLIEEVKEVQETPEIAPDESNENLTPLKKCNVVRYIPTQVNPIWKCGLCETYVGYHFSYRGMPLQAYTTGGWCKDNVTTTIFIVDPVIGLPITHYDGMLSDIEEVLAGVFIKYLQTIENNKEAIVQIARAFEDLKRQTNNMTA